MNRNQALDRDTDHGAMYTNNTNVSRVFLFSIVFGLVFFF